METNKLKAPRKQWIKFSVAALIYILFCVWVGNLWILLGFPVVFDLYISKLIPWTWWKKIKNDAFRKVFEWVDAIVFALIAVYFINLFLFQNYKIPTSSLEKTLLVGDFLFVSKVAYGPRVPNTPLSFPLVQHTFPVINSKSYFDKPQWEYKRLKGFGNVKRNDIVVFNFPAGDSIPLLADNIDYQTYQQYKPFIDQVAGQNPDYYTLCYYYGRENIKNSPLIKKIIERPVDRRENYVKRCVGIPGDTLQIIDNQLFVNHQPQEKIDGIQLNYFVQTNGTAFTNDDFEALGVSKDDRVMIAAEQQSDQLLMHIGIPLQEKGKPIYHMPLTKAALTKLSAISDGCKVYTEKDISGDGIYPLGNNYGWTRDNFGPIWIPKKGETIELRIDNINIYEKPIRNYEKNTLTIKDSIIYINGKVAKEYTFTMNYYWMMGDNRHNSADSRYWGFVPEDHIVGQPVFVWLSLDKDKSLFNGGIRWKRFLRSAKK
jgi:signal peptidase I